MTDPTDDPSGSPADRGRGPAGQPTQLDTVWSALVEDLPPNQRAWLAASRPVTLHESTAIIAVADDFTRNQLEGRLRTRLEDALGASFDRQVRIAVTVDPELGGLDRDRAPATRAAGRPALPRSRASTAAPRRPAARARRCTTTTTTTRR